MRFFLNGIPLEKMLLSEKEKLLSLEQHLQKRVVGQEAAINAVSNSVRRARTYIDDPRFWLLFFLRSYRCRKNRIGESFGRYSV